MKAAAVEREREKEREKERQNPDTKNELKVYKMALGGDSKRTQREGSVDCFRAVRFSVPRSINWNALRGRKSKPHREATAVVESKSYKSSSIIRAESVHVENKSIQCKRTAIKGGEVEERKECSRQKMGKPRGKSISLVTAGLAWVA